MIVRPTKEEAEIQAAQDRLDREAEMEHARMLQSEQLEQEHRTAVKKEVLTRKAKRSCIWAITILTLFKRNVPDSLTNFLVS